MRLVRGAKFFARHVFFIFEKEKVIGANCTNWPKGQGIPNV